jgi:predicted DNA-binding transcriptional regulator YafY
MTARLTSRTMDRSERFHTVLRLLRARPRTFAELMDELEVSRATLKRDLEYLRSRFEVPIEYDRDSNLYRIGTVDGRTELPGLWFNASEVHALLTMQRLLAEVEPGLLGPHLAPLAGRVEKLLGLAEGSASELKQRIRVLSMARRTRDLVAFETIAMGVVQRRQLNIRHHNRARDEVSERTVSPQRLVHYRDNWYLDTWCHQADGIRTFAVDAIQAAQLLDTPARAVDGAELDRVVAAGYGIFAGREVQWATLRFTPLAARWVSAETWHPEQRGRHEPDGSWVLEVPYSDDRELVMDLLRHGAEVEVLSPPGLRTRVRAALEAALRRY